MIHTVSGVDLIQIAMNLAHSTAEDDWAKICRHVECHGGIDCTDKVACLNLNIKF